MLDTPTSIDLLITPPTFAILERRLQGEERTGALYPLHELARDEEGDVRAVTLGRASDNAVLIDDDGCSRHHAEIRWDASGWILVDCNSTNGTLANGSPVRSPRPLHDGDRVRIGKVELHFRSEDPSRTPNQTKRSGKLLVKWRDDDTQAEMAAPVTAQAAAHGFSLRSLRHIYETIARMGQCDEVAAHRHALLDGLRVGTGADCAVLVALRDDGSSRILAARDNGSVPTLPEPRELFRAGADQAGSILEWNGAEYRAKPLMVLSLPLREASEAKPHALLLLASRDRSRPLLPEHFQLARVLAGQFVVGQRRIRERTRITQANEDLQALLRRESQLVGDSEAIRGVLDQIALVAPTLTTVLVRGESGVGKELVARSLHVASPRRNGPLVCVNCAAIPESLLEAELFGHEKGAFTGADRMRKGKFELADGGTLFLDEIGELPLAMQAKLLRVLDGNPFVRVGGTRPVETEVRIVAATNRDLPACVAEKTFRADLYYRLQVVELLVPPLRERPEDILPLARHFLREFAAEMRRPTESFSPSAEASLQAHAWPGNVRELRNVIERAVVLNNQRELTAEALGLGPVPPPDPRTEPFEPRSLVEIEAEHIARTLRFTNNNKSQAAAILGIERSTLDRKLKRQLG